MKKALRNNSLTIAMLALFTLSFVGQVASGFHVYNDDQKEHHQREITVTEYLRTGHFVEATFENWESEFLQMAAFILLTAFLFQKGSSESKDPDQKSDPESKIKRKPGSPWPVHRGGLALKLYEHSLSSTLFIMFVLSFLLHARGGAMEFSRAQELHGGAPISTLAFMKTSTFWFESFQNWQSEFLSIAVLLVLAIFLRERGSPQSKRVGDPNSRTGE